MITVDLDAIAAKIVHECMRVRRGEVILVHGGPHHFEFIEDLAVHVRRAGAFSVVRINSARLERRILTEADLADLQQTPVHWINWLDELDGFIYVEDIADPRLLMDLDETKVGALRAAGEPFRRERDRRNKRWTFIGYPTPERAALYGLPFDEYHDMLWRAIDVDYAAIARRGRALERIVSGAQRVEVTSARGTHLTFSLAGRTALVDDGIIDDGDFARRDVGNNLPCGEVFIAPIEDSAEGRAIFDLAFHRGHPIRDLVLTFRSGQVLDVDATTNADLFRQVLATSTGDKDRIGEFGIGLNPAIHRLTGNDLLDEKIIGSIHIALGENASFGGRNESSLHWDLVMLGPTVKIDGRVIMQGGKLLVGNR